MKVAISTSSFAEYDAEPLRLLRSAGLETKLNPFGRALDAAEAQDFLQDCVGLIAGTEPLNAKVMEASPKLKAISRCGTGMDNVDLQAAARLGVTVRNTPDAPVAAVAELTLGLALDLMRRISRQDREIRAGQWKKRMGNLLSGKKVGIVGFGRIGRKVAGYFSAFGCETAFYDPLLLSDAVYARMELTDLLAFADILTLHCPPRPDGLPLLDAAGIAAMKAGAWLINAARGGLIDEEALCGALGTGAVAGAALDVFGREPYPADGPLSAFPNVILTPHIGAYAVESRIGMEIESALNLLSALGIPHE
ncbi:MAG: phosphoglycerate dehydrogenase [Desulfovibrio sp.]|jgi:D-3-phosphoglycerate dehydrogenase|nr:phosphoglycerate dehydrogenase [Desulfovibrio sp.]